MLVYSTASGSSSFDPAGYAAEPVGPSETDPHAGCVHSIGYCGDADWE